ncbi:MAG: hypothetical protein AABZ02_00160 [Bacteroidota bacterium]
MLVKPEKFKTYRRLLVIVLAVTLADLTARFDVDFETSRVVSLEAILFLMGGAMLLWAAKRDKAESLSAQRLDLWLALAFGLAGVRAALWAIGIPVFLANPAILALGIALGALLIIWSRRSGRHVVRGDTAG